MKRLTLRTKCTLAEAKALASIVSIAERAQQRYGDFASTHEALGVALEEWHELIEAIKSNDLPWIRAEAIDLAAVIIRLACQCEDSDAFKNRSTK